MPHRMSHEARDAFVERLKIQGIRFARAPVTTLPDNYHKMWVDSGIPIRAGRIYSVKSLVHTLHLVGLKERHLEDWMRRTIEPATMEPRLAELDPGLRLLLETYPSPDQESDTWLDYIEHEYFTMPRERFVRWAEWGWCPRTYCRYLESSEGEIHTLFDSLADDSPYNPARRGPGHRP